MPTPQPITRPKQLPKIKLPDHIELSERELATTVKLVRLLRSEHTWLGYFIEALLEKDASETGDLSTGDVKTALQDFDNLSDWKRVLGALGERYPNLRNHPATTWTQHTYVQPEGDDQDFFELVKLWRKDHPEPKQRDNALLRVLQAAEREQ